MGVVYRARHAVTGQVAALACGLLAVVGIVICQKYRVYTRDVKAWNVLTKFHYPVLVVTFMALGFGLGFISSLQKASNDVLDERLHPALTGLVPPVQETY